MMDPNKVWVSVIISVIGLIVIVIIYTNFNEVGSKSLSDSECRVAVNLASMKIAGISAGSINEVIKNCRTNDIVFETKDDVKNVEIIVGEIANCWNDFGGITKDFTSDWSGSQNYFCFICSRFRYKDESSYMLEGVGSKVSDAISRKRTIMNKNLKSSLGDKFTISTKQGVDSLKVGRAKGVDDLILVYTIQKLVSTDLVDSAIELYTGYKKGSTFNQSFVLINREYYNCGKLSFES